MIEFPFSEIMFSILPTISTTLSNLSIESKLWAFWKRILLSPFVFDHVLNLNHDVLVRATAKAWSPFNF